MEEALTQTRREVRSERISAICIAGEVWGDCFEGGKSGGLKGGEDLPRANLHRSPRQRYGSPLEAAAVRTDIFALSGGFLWVYRTGWIRVMASIRANCRKIVCIGRNYAYVIRSGRTLGD
jgi:hypothetical protein